MPEIQYKHASKDWWKKKEKEGYFIIQNGTIQYPIGYRDNFNDPEEKVRGELFVDLVEKYQYRNSKEIIEMEKLHKIGHPRKKTDAKIDLLIKRDGTPFMMFELKAPEKYEEEMERSIDTQLFNVGAVEDKGQDALRYLIYYTRYWENGDLREKIVTIDYKKYKSYESWEAAGRPNLLNIPINYGIVRKPTFIKGGLKDLRTNVTKDELQRIRRDLHNILYGGGKYQNELFFNLIGLLLVKIFDEKETEEGKPYQFQVFQQEGEDTERTEGTEEIYTRMNDLYFKALEKYLGYSKEAIKKSKDIVFDAPKVRYVVEVLQEISFTVSKYDAIGDFFEGIVRGEFKQSKGQYLTHTNIINFVIRALELENLAIDLINSENRLPFLMDPACGSGAFLIESMKYISEQILSNLDSLKKNQAVRNFVQDNFPDHRKNAWAQEYIYGIEIHGDLAAATKVNMVGHGDGSANIEAKDSLIDFGEFGNKLLQTKETKDYYPKPLNEQFDVIVSNPPFSVKVDRETAKKLPANFVQGEDIVRRLKKSKELEVATELLFIERWFQLLRPKGRLGVVLPESVFDTTTNRGIRLFLYKYFYIRAIVSLPPLAFAPFTQTKTSLLFAQKKTDDEVEEWVELWNKFSQKYTVLHDEVDFFFGKDPLYETSKELITKYRKKYYAYFEEDDFYSQYKNFNKVVHVGISENDLISELIEFITTYLHETNEEFNEEYFRLIVSRKKKLPLSVKDKHRRETEATKMVAILIELLGDFFDEEDANKSPQELREIYKGEVKLADSDWWIFSKVARELNYEIFMAHADEIGYKRGIRREEERLNQLFSTSENGEIILNPDKAVSILDHIRESIVW